MSEPTREQVEAVARSINPEAYEEWPIGYVSMRAAIGLQRRNLERDLASLLTSTDPAVWDAIAAHIPMDALVRVGRLTEETATRPRWEECVDPSHHHGGLVVEPEGSGRSHITEWVPTRRFVTEWTEAPDA